MPLWLFTKRGIGNENVFYRQQHRYFPMFMTNFSWFHWFFSIHFNQSIQISIEFIATLYLCEKLCMCMTIILSLISLEERRKRRCFPACWTHFCIEHLDGQHRGVRRGGQGRHNSPSAESLWGRRKVPTLSQVLSSIQYICFRKTLGSNMGRQTCFLTRTPSNLGAPLGKQFCAKWSTYQ